MPTIPPMRLVFVAPFGLQPKGTTRHRALPLARALVRRGASVALLVPPWDDPERSGSAVDVDGVSVRHLLLPPRLPLAFHPWLALRLLRATRAQHAEVVHVFKPKGPSGFVTFWLHWLHRVGRGGPRVVQDTDDWEGSDGWNDRAGYPAWQRHLFAWQERWCLRRAKAVTAASLALVERARALGSPNVHFLPNGPPEVHHASPAEIAAVRASLGLDAAPTALLYTRFAEFRPERAADLWCRILDRVPSARLVVISRGLRNEEARFFSTLGGLGVQQTTRRVPWPEPADLAGYLQSAHVALFPYDDNLLNRTKCSVKLVELMANGLPVVAEDVGMNGHYLRDRLDGRLVPPAAAPAFAAAVSDLLCDPATAQQMGRSAALRAQGEFPWSRLAERAEAAYASIAP
jgi:glycosyltransferase involved in cell wall biosynthesis